MYEVGEGTRVKRCAKAGSSWGSSPLPSRTSVSQQGTEAVSAGHFNREVLGHRSAWAAPTEVGGRGGGRTRTLHHGLPLRQWPLRRFTNATSLQRGCGLGMPFPPCLQMGPSGDLLKVQVRVSGPSQSLQC